MRLFCLLFAVFLICSTGCNTIRTTFLRQNNCGDIVKEPCHYQKGLPVMVEVPTHVDVRILQTDFWKMTKDAAGGDVTSITHVPEATSRSTEIEPVFTEQMFLMDPKRPAEGTGQFKFTFNSIDDDGKGKDNGTLKKVEYKADDKTLAATADLIAAAAKTFAKTSFDDSPDVVVNTRTIALKRFPVGEEYEGEIQAFIARYINGCADGSCLGSPTYTTPLTN